MSKLDLPPDFIRTIQNTFGEDGKQFISDLPALIGEVSQRWALTDIQPVSNLSYNFVAFARRSGENVVLKMGVPNRELTSEMAALRLFDGEGACRLIESDEQRGLLLLERLQPGQMLATLKDDEEATHTAADVMLRLWRPAPQEEVFIKLSDWFDGFKRMRARFAGGTGPLDRNLVERAESIAKDFFAEDYVPTLMHGDFHYFNVLLSERGWLVIDPKGVIGPAAYEVGPLLINPWMVSGLQPTAPWLIRNRISILSERLGFEKQRLRKWGLAHAVLSAWWSLEDNEDPQPALECAAILAEMRL